VNATEWAMSETFEDCKKNLDITVRNFQKQHGGDYDDLWSEAQLKFIHAYRSYDPKQGTDFKTWLYTKVWWGLYEVNRRKNGRDASRPQTHTIIGEGDIPDQRRLPWHERKRNLSPDTRTIIKLVSQLLENLQMMGVKSYEHSKEVRKPLIALFLREIGWSLQRIAESFGEIRDALQDSL